MPHREFSQNNYVTALKWGHKLGQELENAPGLNGYTGKWVILDKYNTGEFTLRIEDQAPTPPLIK